jgi:hypothetical protein
VLESNLDGHTVIRAKDYNNVEDLSPVYIGKDTKYYSSILASDFRYLEMCGILLVARGSKPAIKEQPPHLQPSNEQGKPCIYVERLAQSIYEALPFCSLDDYELLISWLVEAEKANYALSCARALEEDRELYCTAHNAYRNDNNAFWDVLRELEHAPKTVVALSLEEFSLPQVSVN